jgi:hypothetical protein
MSDKDKSVASLIERLNSIRNEKVFSYLFRLDWNLKKLNRNLEFKQQDKIQWRNTLSNKRNNTESSI